MILNDIIIRPLITEKSMAETAKSKFTFLVLKSANKHEIKAVVEKLFHVKVIAVATSIVKGRSVRAGVRRVEVVKTPTKKAIVVLQAGQKIDLFEIGA